MKTLLRTSIGALALMILASCATTMAGHEHHEHGTGDGRLVVSQANGDLTVLEAADGDVVKSFGAAVPDGGGTVYSNAQGTIAYVLNRSANTVVALHSGQHLAEHEGHEDLKLEAPALLGTYTKGLLPTHFNTLEGRSVVYNDGSGNLTVIDEAHIEHGGLDQVSTLAPATADHGAMILLPEGMLVGTLKNPDVVFMDYAGKVKKSFSGAVSLHGQSRLGRYSAFGLATGVMVFTQTGSELKATVVPNPAGTPEKARVSTLKSHPVRDYFLGNLGDGLARIDPAQLQITPVALPTTPWKFGFDRSGQYIVVLGTNGSLIILGAETWKTLATLPLVPARNPDAPTGTPVPALALGSKHAFVSNPVDNTIAVVDLEDGKVDRRYTLTGSPIVSFDLLVTDGVVHE